MSIKKRVNGQWTEVNIFETATSSKAGLMTPTDKQKLDSISGEPFIITCDLGENTGFPMTALINFSHSVEEIFNYMEENANNKNLSKSIILRMNDGGTETVDMYLTSYTASELYFGVCVRDSNYTARLGWDGDHYIGIHELLTTYTITNQISEGDERLPTSIAVYEAIAASKASLNTETWTFTLEDGSTVTKAVYVG